MLASPSPRPSRWGSAFSVPGEAVAIGRTLASLPGARRVVLRGAQRLKDRQGARAPRPLARSASGLPPIRATLQPRVLPPMPGSRLLPSLGAPGAGPFRALVSVIPCTPVLFLSWPQALPPTPSLWHSV